MFLQNGDIVECDRLMAVFGEVVIPERAWQDIKQIDTLKSRVIVSVENKGAFVDFPATSQATLLFLPGDNTGPLEQVTSRMPHQALIHFGDLDPQGIQIYRNLTDQCPGIHHFVPSYAEEYLITANRDAGSG